MRGYGRVGWLSDAAAGAAAAHAYTEAQVKPTWGWGKLAYRACRTAGGAMSDIPAGLAQWGLDLGHVRERV